MQIERLESQHVQRCMEVIFTTPQVNYKENLFVISLTGDLDEKQSEASQEKESE